MYPTNCPNCAATLHNGKCAHCGTEVVGDIRFNEWIEFNLTGSDAIGNKYIIPVCGRITNLSTSYDTHNAYDYTGRIIKSIIARQNIEFTFEGEIRRE